MSCAIKEHLNKRYKNGSRNRMLGVHAHRRTTRRPQVLQASYVVGIGALLSPSLESHTAAAVRFVLGSCSNKQQLKRFFLSLR